MGSSESCEGDVVFGTESHRTAKDGKAVHCSYEKDSEESTSNQFVLYRRCRCGLKTSFNKYSQGDDSDGYEIHYSKLCFWKESIEDDRETSGRERRLVRHCVCKRGVELNNVNGSAGKTPVNPS